MTIVGTRPEIIRLSRVSAVLDAHVEHILVHTGQNHDYELNQVFYDDLQLRRPDHFLDAATGSPASTIGAIIIKSDEVMRSVKPDALLVLGDTNSCLAAISAKRLQIPVFHMEAGNRCFDDRVPEEINRRIVDHLSDINLPYSDISREYLLREGFPPDRIIKTGSPMYEVLQHYGPQIEASSALERLGLDMRGYLLMSIHREENIESDRQFAKFTELLRELPGRTGLRLIVSTHPRTRKRLERGNFVLPTGVELLKPLGFFDYVRLQQDAACVLSDSGTITEESSILNFPAVNMRDAHERPEGMEEGVVIMAGLDLENVLAAIAIASAQPRGSERQFPIVRDYVAPNVSEKVLRIILSYTPFVRRVVWRNY
jgi:UDP-N-acetylglucosamine 2-epimerase (non-hydrolysing)